MPWFKFDHSTPEKQQVLEVATALGLPRAQVIGALCLIWRWFSEQTVAGLSRDNPGILDIVSETPGIGEQLERVGWLVRGGGTMSIPGFDRWTGSAQEARRRQKNRLRAAENDGNGTVPGQRRDGPPHVPPQTQTQTQTSDSSSLRSEERAEARGTGNLPGIEFKPPKGKSEPSQDQIDLLVVKPIWLKAWLARHQKPYAGLEGSSHISNRRRSALRTVFRRLNRDEAEFRKHCESYLAAPLFKDRQNPDPIAMLDSFDAVRAGLTLKDHATNGHLNGTPKHGRRPDGTRDGEYSEPIQFPRVADLSGGGQREKQEDRAVEGGGLSTAASRAS